MLLQLAGGGRHSQMRLKAVVQRQRRWRAGNLLIGMRWPPASLSACTSILLAGSRRGFATQKLSPDMKKAGGTLALYCHDLTEQAKQGKLDSVIGRDAEIKRELPAHW